MGSIIFTMPDDEEEKLRHKAKSLGLTLSAYLRRMVTDSLRRNPEIQHTQLLKSIRALVPTIAEAFGRTQNVPQEKIERLTQVLIERFEKEQ